MAKLLLVFSFVVLGVFSRLIPHPPNFTPLGALSIFSGIYFKNLNAGLLPLIVLGLSDLLISGYYGPVMFYVYGSFWLIFLLASMWAGRLKDFRYLFLFTLLTSVLFFVVTNFAVWFHTNLYPRNFGGLILCYLAALPFFRNSLVGDIFYVTLILLLEHIYYQVRKFNLAARFYEYLHPNR